MSSPPLSEGALPLGTVGEAEWRRLRRQIQLSAGFWLGVVTAAASWQADEIYARTCQQIALHGRQGRRFIAARPEGLTEVLPWLLTPDAAQAGMLWVQGQDEEESAAWSHAWGELLLRCNERRDRLRRHIRGGLVLVLPAWARSQMRDAASDLWSVRSIVIDLPAQKESEPRTISVCPRRLETLIAARLRLGQRCLVVAPPRAGTSLMRVRVTHRLQESGTPCATLHLTEIFASSGGPERACHVLFESLSNQLGWGAVRRWEELAGLDPVQRLQRCCSEALGRRPDLPVILFLDPSELLLSPAPGLRTLVELFRPAGSEGGLLSLAGATTCLLGAAFPSQLGMTDDEGTFWLGALDQVELEAQPEGAPWRQAPPQTKALVLAWTGGDPGMTWGLMEAMRRPAPEGLTIEERCERALRAAYVNATYRDDAIVGLPAQRIAEMGELRLAPALDLYLRILRGERVSLQEGDMAHQDLWLTGLLLATGSRGSRLLSPRNRTLATIYDAGWAEFERLRLPAAPSRSLLEDYQRAILHVAWARLDGQLQLLLAAVELLPDEIEPIDDDGLQQLQLERGELCLRHLVLDAGSALAWYRECARGEIRLPDSSGRLALNASLSPPPDEDPPWPCLRADRQSELPFKAGWHGKPRTHRLRAGGVTPTALFRQDELPQVQAWLEEGLYCPAEMCLSFLGVICLLAPNPVFRLLESRLSPGEPGADSIRFRCWPRAGQALAGQELLVLDQPRLQGGRLYRLPLTGRLAQLDLNHELGWHELAVHDPQRGLLYAQGPSAFFRQAGAAPGARFTKVVRLRRREGE